MDRRPLRVLSLSFPKRSLFKLGLIGGLAASHFHQSLREHCWEIESSPWMLYRRCRKHAPARGPAPPTPGQLFTQHLQQHSPHKSASRRDGRATAVGRCLALLASAKRTRTTCLQYFLKRQWPCLCATQRLTTALASTTPRSEDLQDHFHLTFVSRVLHNHRYRSGMPLKGL